VCGQTADKKCSTLTNRGGVGFDLKLYIATMTSNQCAAGKACEKGRRICCKNPWIAGVSIGLLSWFAFALVNQPIGVSTAMSAASGEVASPILGRNVFLTDGYWIKFPFSFDYGVLFLIGIFIGGLVSALTSNTFKWERMPRVWRDHFGGSVTKRLIVAFIGGVLALFGARMAGGCTSGHGLSGGLQLALSSWVFLITMFVVGVLFAALLFRNSRNDSTKENL
jgi:uncharacterized protein